MDKSSDRIGGTDDVPEFGTLPSEVDILSTIQSLKSEVDDLKKTFHEQAVKHQQALDEQAVKHQQAFDEQVDMHKSEIDQLNAQIKDLQVDLKKATGQTPKSERNRNSTTKGGGDSGGGDGSGSGSDREEGSTNKEQYDFACADYKLKKRNFEREEIDAGRNPGETYLKWHIKLGSDMAIVPAAELQMDCPIGIPQEINHPVLTLTEQEKIDAFGTNFRPKISAVSAQRYGFRIAAITKNIRYQVATGPEIIDEDGQIKTKSISAGSNQFGPIHTKVSWEGLANSLILCTTFAVPMERIGRIVGNGFFNAKNINRWIQQCAWHLLPIYLWFFERLSIAKVIRMDDTGINVEEMTKLIQSRELIPDIQFESDTKAWEQFLNNLRKKAAKRGLPPLVPKIAEVLGRVAPYRDTLESKASYNLSCISWLLDPSDTRSTVLFFRTHFGSCANLVSNALRNRPANLKELVHIIADAAAVNSLDPDLSRFIQVVYQGCYHHARRYVTKFEALDIELASYLLRQFLRLDELEWQASRAPMKLAGLSDAREQAKPIWGEIFEVANSVVNQKLHPRAKNKIWKKGTKVYNGCQYFLNHKKELTLYLANNFLVGNNTFIERALRPQKRIMESAPVRKSESSQCGFDIIRTLAATCECAGLVFKDYLSNLMQVPRAMIAANPGNFDPYTISRQP